jgi:hypothetical protein
MSSISGIAVAGKLFEATWRSSTPNRIRVYWVAIDPLKVVRPSALVSDLKAQDGPGVFCDVVESNLSPQAIDRGSRSALTGRSDSRPEVRAPRGELNKHGRSVQLRSTSQPAPAARKLPHNLSALARLSASTRTRAQPMSRTTPWKTTRGSWPARIVGYFCCN